MNSERWQQCKQIFQATLDLPRSERPAYVRQACGEDDELRREVTSLLEAEERSDKFLSGAAANYLGGAFGEAPGDNRLPAGQVLAARYRILRLIGRGGMGEVYEAEDLELKAPVALKLVRPEIAVHPEILDRFKREVYLARQVTHPNVCRIFDLGHHAGPAGRLTFLTMEMLAGETLSDRLARTGPMHTAEALPLVQQLAEGLTAAHRAGIVHRDFKSGNVILAPETGEGDPGGRVKIMDFGLARAVSGGDHVRTTLTVAGGLIGTPAYMAPEQIEGGEITPATDIYALGVVMYEMVTGTLPFAGENPWIVAARRLREAPAPPRTYAPHLDRTWEAVIMRCLERIPGARFQSGMDVIGALRGEPLEPVKMPSAPGEDPRKRLGPWVIAAILAALFFGSAIGYRLLTRSHGTSVQRPPESGVTTPAQYGWHQIALPADPSMFQAEVVAGSLDPLQLALFGPSFTRTWAPGQNLTPPLPTTFAVSLEAECAPGVWLIHDDRRHITKWDPGRQQPLATLSLPWPVDSAVCLDEKATRWGFLVREPTARWIEFDAKTNRAFRTIPLDDTFIKATLDPRKKIVVLIGSSRISVRGRERFDEIFHDTLGEELLAQWASAWSETGRYFSLGFKQLAIYDMAAKRRVQTLATAGWISAIGWIGDDAVGAMDDRGRLYWTADIAKDWQLKQDPPSPGVYRPFWVGSHYRWIAFRQGGGGLVWEYITPPLLFDLQVSPLEVWSVAVSPDGAQLAVSGKDPRIFVVDLAQRKTVHILEGHTDGVPFVRFEKSGRLISASDDKTLRLWDTSTGKLLKTATGHTSLVNAFAISPDGQWLVSVSSDEKIKLWRLPELDYVKDIGKTASGGAAAAFLPHDGEQLLISDWKGYISLYQGTAPNWSMRQQSQLSKGVIYMVCPSQDAWWAIARAVHEGDVEGMWLVPAKDIAKAAKVNEDTPSYCATGSDGRLTAVEYADRIELRSNADGKPSATYRFAAREGAAAAIREHPATVIAGVNDGHVLAWPIAQPRP
ncbi:MAG: protein kinase [Bryobacteraceae bacterium]